MDFVPCVNPNDWLPLILQFELKQHLQDQNEELNPIMKETSVIEL